LISLNLNIKNCATYLSWRSLYIFPRVTALALAFGFSSFISFRNF